MTNQGYTPSGEYPQGYYLDATTIYDSQSHHSNEKDYNLVTIKVLIDGSWVQKHDCFLRVYPIKFNNCDAYLDMNLDEQASKIEKVYFPKTDQTWSVHTIYRAGANGRYRGDFLNNVSAPPRICFCLQL